jgi:phage-related protein
MSIETRAVVSGVWTIVALVRNGRALASGHIAALPGPERAKVLRLLVRVSFDGPPANVQRNRKLDADIWELKSGQTRLLYFIEGSRVIVLTHGFAKKQQKLPRRELDHARRLRAEYLESR